MYGEPPAAPVTASSRPVLAAIAAGVSALNPQPLGRMLALTRWCSRVPRRHPQPGSSTTSGFYGDFSSFQWGGPEEAVIAKGSPWPQELARVLSGLLQLANLPARIVFLYGEEPPLLHAVVETWVRDRWAVCDPCANRCYIWPHRGYASALDLQQHPRLVDQAPEHGRNPYVDGRLFRTIAIAEYVLSSKPPPDGDLAPARPEDREILRAAAQVFEVP